VSDADYSIPRLRAKTSPHGLHRERHARRTSLLPLIAVVLARSMRRRDARLLTVAHSLDNCSQTLVRRLGWKASARLSPGHARSSG
jgi:hypothetical protein